MADKIRFGDTIRMRGSSGQSTFMVLDCKPAEKKGDWAGWYKVIRLSPNDGSTIAQNSTGEITFIPHTAAVKVV